MPIDSALKRKSATDAESPWDAAAHVPDGAILQADRQHATWTYTGILSASPPVVVTQDAPLDWIVELRDRNFALVGRLEPEVEALEWGYSRIGGCDALRMVLNRAFEDLGVITVDYDVQIKVKNPTTHDYELWWRGFIEGRQASFSDRERVVVDGFGYVSQLQRILINRTYTSTEVSAIVTDILDTDVTPNTKIVKNAAKIASTGVTPDSVVFANVTADQAIKTLAEIVGGREWGVDRTRDFYFQARVDTVLARYLPGRHVVNYRVLDSFGKITNRVKLEGGDVAGVKYQRTVNNAASQTKFGLREKVVVRTSIKTDAVADAFAAAIMQEEANIQRRADLELRDITALVETTTPLGTVIVRGPLGGTTWGTKKWGTFLWGGELKHQVNAIQYRILTSGLLRVHMDLGQSRPDLMEILKDMGQRLEEVRAR